MGSNDFRGNYLCSTPFPKHQSQHRDVDHAQTISWQMARPFCIQGGALEEGCEGEPCPTKMPHTHLGHPHCSINCTTSLAYVPEKKGTKFARFRTLATPSMSVEGEIIYGTMSHVVGLEQQMSVDSGHLGFVSPYFFQYSSSRFLNPFYISVLCCSFQQYG